MLNNTIDKNKQNQGIRDNSLILIYPLNNEVVISPFF